MGVPPTLQAHPRVTKTPEVDAGFHQGARRPASARLTGMTRS
jgi:hypothetical protein